MKRFKVRKKYNYIKIIIFFILLIIFSLLSLIKLDTSHTKLVKLLTNKFKDDNVNIITFTNNLDYLLNTYSFKDNSTENLNIIIYDNNGD